jgi:hypothetical protein
MIHVIAGGICFLIKYGVKSFMPPNIICDEPGKNLPDVWFRNSL